MENQSESPKTAIYKKISLVANEIMNIEKDMTIGTGSYAYKAVSDAQVTLAVKKAEKKHNVISIPIKQELLDSKVERVINKKGDEVLMHVDNIKMTVKIVDLDSGEFECVESFGKGIDSADKGFGKASTYARKYALLNAYKIATGEDPDADQSPETAATPTTSERHKKVIDYLNSDMKVRNNTLEHFSVQDVGDLNKTQLDTIYDTFTKKKLL
jgi:hypothetical protein